MNEQTKKTLEEFTKLEKLREQAKKNVLDAANLEIVEQERAIAATQANIAELKTFVAEVTEVASPRSAKVSKKGNKTLIERGKGLLAAIGAAAVMLGVVKVGSAIIKSHLGDKEVDQPVATATADDPNDNGLVVPDEPVATETPQATATPEATTEVAQEPDRVTQPSEYCMWYFENNKFDVENEEHLDIFAKACVDTYNVSDGEFTVIYSEDQYKDLARYTNGKLPENENMFAYAQYATMMGSLMDGRLVATENGMSYYEGTTALKEMPPVLEQRNILACMYNGADKEAVNYILQSFQDIDNAERSKNHEKAKYEYLAKIMQPVRNFMDGTELIPGVTMTSCTDAGKGSVFLLVLHNQAFAKALYGGIDNININNVSYVPDASEKRDSFEVEPFDVFIKDVDHFREISMNNIGNTLYIQFQDQEESSKSREVC